MVISFQMKKEMHKNQVECGLQKNEAEKKGSR